MKEIKSGIINLILDFLLFIIAVSIILGFSVGIFYIAKTLAMRYLDSWERFIEIVLISILSFIFFVFYESVDEE